MENLINTIKKSKTECFFISPHLDDAVLSAGTLIEKLSKTNKVTVINIFTEANKNCTLSAKVTLKNAGFSDPKEYFVSRKQEDKAVIEKLGVSRINLRYADALWRVKTKKLHKLAGKLLPEFQTVYSTYKFHIERGKISNSDKTIIEEISAKLKKIVGAKTNAFVFAPIGIGKHVDHIIINKICSISFENVIYWSDFPYNTSAVKTNYDGYENLISIEASKANNKLIMAYKTQFLSMFPNSKVPQHQEQFFNRSPEEGFK